jgi:hypothetical protein
MKNLLILSVFAAAFFSSCNKAEGPKEVATKFLTHLNAGEYDAAGEFGTESTKEMLGMIKMFAGEEKPEAAVPFTISDVKEEGETATVTYRSEGAEADETIDLVKTDGKWLVNMVKEEPNMDEMGDMGGDMEEGMTEEGEVTEGVESTEEVVAE